MLSVGHQPQVISVVPHACETQPRFKHLLLLLLLLRAQFSFTWFPELIAVFHSSFY